MKKLLLLIFLWATSFALSAQGDLAKKLPMDSKIRTGILSNGIKYYVRYNAKPEKRAELRIALNAGSTAENDDQQGLAHFTEHMAFNGSKNFKKNEMIDFLESLGVKFGAHLNAYTSFDETVYMIQLPTDKEDTLIKGFDILEDWAHNLSFDPAEVDKERGVVVEEWRLGQGANERMRRKYWPTLFKDSRYAERLPIGKKEILENCKVETLKDFYKDWYRPDLMAVIAVGDFDVDKVEGIIKEKFSSIPPKKNPRPLVSWEVPDQKEFAVSTVTDKEATFTIMQLIYKLPSEKASTEGEYRKMIMQSLYNGMMNQRLTELQKQADAPFIFAQSAYDDLVRNKSAYFSYAAVKSGGIERGLTTLITENERVKRYGFTESELERQKKDALRGIEKAFNERDKSESRNFASEYVSNYLTGEPIPGVEFEYELYKKYLPGITAAEMNQLASVWLAHPENAVLIVMGPEKDGLVYPTDDKLKQLVAEAYKAEIGPYVDKVINKPLVEKIPTGAKVTEEKQFGEFGVTKWKLANGATVYIKPTDFKNDEIIFNAFSMGGTSVVPDSNFLSGDYSNLISDESGLGEFDRISLDKMLQGKIVNLGTYIDTYTEGLSGNCSPQDIETFLQLLYLNFTAPRKDETAFKSIMEQQKAMLQNRLSSPEAIFSDTISYAMSGYSFRSKPMTAEMLNDINLDRAYSIFKNRFSDASNFTFTFVGNFKPEELKPFVETYIGGIPSTNSNESFKDLGIKGPKGKFERTVKKGVEPKSSVSMRFTGEFEYTRKNRFEMNALMKLLSIKLRENLREDKSGVYGVGATPILRHYPKGGYEIVISFGCSPENVNMLIDASMSEINDIKTNGCSEKNLTKIKETFLRERETSLKENSFWLSLISQNAMNGEDLTEISAYSNWVSELESDDFKKLAKKYLGMQNYAKFVLVPEK